MADRVHTPVPAARCNSRPGTALPPLPKGTRALTMKEWDAARHAPRRGWLARLLPTASPAAPAGASTTSAQVVEADLGANRESRS